MKIQPKLLLSTAIIVFASLDLCSGVQPPLTMRIVSSGNGVSVGENIYKAGLPVYVLVTLTNNSSTTLSVPSQDLADYKIDVKDARGNPVGQSDEARKTAQAMNSPTNSLRNRKVVSGLNGEVKPGSSWKDTIQIDAYLDIKRPGKYTVQLERQFPGELGIGSVKSNQLIITLTE